MLFRKKYGFTLVELLVVISILGILAAALTTQVSKARSMGQSVRCKANLRNLAQAAINYGTETRRMPVAGSYEYPWPENVNGRHEYRYREYRGWVGWTGTGSWRAKDPQAGSMQDAVAYSSGKEAYLSITNGVLWERVGKDLAVYVCDVHKDLWKSTKSKAVMRSYVMNSYFGYRNNGSKLATLREVWMDNLASSGNAANLLLFAESPPLENNGGVAELSTIDGVLESTIRGYPSANGRQEILGFYHRVGKRYVAHVAFSDGHVDVLIQPEKGNITDLKDLTEQLCNGDEIESDLRKKMR